MSALKVVKIIKIINGIHIMFIVFQLESAIKIPADKLPVAWIEYTIKSFNPWALNFSSYL